MEELYDRLDEFCGGKHILIKKDELEMLENIRSFDDIEQIQDDYCLGALIVRACGILEFYRVMDKLKENLPANIFNFLIDYDGELTNGRSTIDALFCERENENRPLKEVFDAIEKYFDRKFSMIYEIITHSEYSTIADYIISNDKTRGKEKILDELRARDFKESEFDIKILDDIWENYHK
jgi:hypothetical protein